MRCLASTSNAAIAVHKSFMPFTHDCLLDLLSNETESG